MALAALAAPAAVRAHGLDPAALTLRETTPGVFDVRWRSAGLRLPGADVQPTLPAHCQRVSAGEASEEIDRVTMRFTVDCGPAGLEGSTIGVKDLAAAKINALLRIERADGDSTQVVLNPQRPDYAVPARPSRAEVVRRSAALGAVSVAANAEQLLFLGALLLLAAPAGGAAKAIAAFALGEGLTLVALALHFTAPPAWPPAAPIALGALLLAVDLSREGEGPTLLRRFPRIAALLGGALYAQSLAATLAAEGTPAQDTALSLAAFHGGLVVAQLGFAASALAVGRGLSSWSPGAARRGRALAVYAIGILAVFWGLEGFSAWLA
jgi:hypothetical protein